MHLSLARKASALIREKYGEWLGDDPHGIFDILNSQKFLLESEHKWGGFFSPWEDKVRIAKLKDPLSSTIHELLHANAFSDDFPPETWGGAKGMTLSFRGIEIEITKEFNRRRVLVKRVNVGLNEGITEYLTSKAYHKAVYGYTEMIPFVNELLKVLGEKLIMRSYFAEGPLWLQQQFDRKVKKTGAFTKLSKSADELYAKKMNRKNKTRCS